MVNKKPKKAVPKKKPAVKKMAATVQKKTTIKKATTAKAKKPVTKKVTKKPAVKSKPKVSSAKKATTSKVKKPAARKPAKKSLKNVIADVNIDIKTQKGSKAQNEKVVNVIDNLSLAKEQKFVTTVAGVFRKVPAVQKISVPAHRQVPIAGILNYFKGIF